MIATKDALPLSLIPKVVVGLPNTIRITTVNTSSLRRAAPDKMGILIAGEFKPDKTLFKQPVILIFTLPQAQVPGTQLSLGCYDTVRKRFIPTGVSSPVAKDGYTVSFPITHFSSYAAMVNLNPISTPIGVGVKIPLPDLLTGSFSHAVPLNVPPGRKGMQPALSLSYRSSNPNSWTGTGFGLNPGCIVRSTRLGPASFNDTTDTFYFLSDAGTTELVHLIDNLYQAKVESSFTKFFKENDTWRVVGKDGSTLYFGQSKEAKEPGSGGTFSWYLTKAIDTNGNYVVFNYTSDQGKAYVYRIEYTGNTSGTAPTNSVDFTLESRDDVASSYISGVKISTAMRLKEVSMSVGQDLAWRYAFEYGYSPDTGRSRITSITQFTSDDKSYPAHTFHYQDAK